MDTTVSYGQVVPQYMMCFETLSSDAWRPSLLKLHLQTKHPGHQGKPWAFFQSQQDFFKDMKIKIASSDRVFLPLVICRSGRT